MNVPRHHERRFAPPGSETAFCGDPIRARPAENRPRGKNLSTCDDLRGPGDVSAGDESDRLDPAEDLSCEPDRTMSARGTRYCGSAGWSGRARGVYRPKCMPVDPAPL